MSNQEIAARESWKTRPIPKRRAKIAFDRSFTEDEFAKLRVGHVPKEMKDKWFLFFEDNWLNFHRSLTGYCIFQLRLQKSADGWHVAEAWANREESQYQSQSGDEDLKLLTKTFRSSLGI